MSVQASVRQLTKDFAIASMDQDNLLLDARNLRLFSIGDSDLRRLAEAEVTSRGGVAVHGDGQAERTIMEMLGDAGSDGKTGMALQLEKERYYDQPFCLRHLTLNVAHACNLGCSYCYAAQGRFLGKSDRSPLMDEHVACASVDALLGENTNAQGKLFIDFFGGEPLLNFAVIRKTIQHVEEKQWGPRISFSVSTNAILLTEVIFEYFHRHHVALYVSVDGDKPLHDLYRRTTGGEGSYERVASNLRRFLPRDPALFSARATITPQTTDFRRIFGHLESLGFREYGFDIAVGSEGDPSTRWEEAALRRLDESFGSYVQELLDRLLKGLDHVVIFVSDALRRIDQREAHAITCRMAAYLIVVTPGGEFYPCYKLTEKKGLVIGTLSDGIDHARRRSLYPRLVDEREGCRTCWARYLCGGGCPAETTLANGDGTMSGRAVCETRKMTWKWMIWLYLRLRKGGYPIARLFTG